MRSGLLSAFPDRAAPAGHVWCHLSKRRKTSTVSIRRRSSGSKVGTKVVDGSAGISGDQASQALPRCASRRPGSPGPCSGARWRCETSTRHTQPRGRAGCGRTVATLPTAGTRSSIIFGRRVHWPAGSPSRSAPTVSRRPSVCCTTLARPTASGRKGCSRSRARIGPSVGTTSRWVPGCCSAPQAPRPWPLDQHGGLGSRRVEAAVVYGGQRS